MRTLVHLVRHGEVFNPHDILYGRLPGYHLSDTGKQMAQVLGEHFRGMDVTYLVSSPLDRARETSAPIADALGLDVATDRRLIEAENQFEGTRFKFRKDGALRNVANWRKLVNPFRPSWGEPYAEIASRMNAAINDAYEKARGHEAVCVSHQLPIWTARQAIEGNRLWHDPRARQCAVASVTTIEFDDGKITGIGYATPWGATKDSVPGA
ncbi:broad specificity phosphatase PhoE [Antricoccus suffuscus]|uniref:Broad specificity phosphatase PhoE n=1 Tax=Antricoccus suffuscus TaxID=1629062 RepID=A0A2T0ZRV0_9ACTN|nr:histidine phosphatase family protein [Antricoccus suffuscus]PRZ39080.1 broad specificity phosphatase PhoE [Antricoccus suffuscus]